MEVNVKLEEDIKVYNVSKFDVKLDKNFELELVGEDESVLLKWFSNNDDILAIKVSPDGSSAKLKATNKGACEIQIQGGQNQILKVLAIEVFDNIAVSLNPQAGAKELK